jgi:DNA invertase Pin-like site-specific DNA recombinase
MNELETYTYDAYTRKSSESEDRQVQSIERQKDDIKEIIERENLTLFGEIIEETKSAFSLGREGFTALVKRTQKGKVNAWLCWHANRLSRNPVDAGTIIHLMDIGKLHHIRTQSRTYYNTPADKMMLQIEFTMSKKDSDDKSLAVRSGLKKRYKNGYPTGRAPLGFLNDKTQEKGNRHWTIDFDRYEKVKLLFSKYLEGKDSLNSITKYAQKVLELTTVESKKQGGILVCRSLVHYTLKNPIYAGFFYAKDEHSERRNLHTLSENIPRVISEEKHVQILNMFGDKAHINVQSHQTPYKGFIVGSKGGYIGADYKFQVICDCKKKFAFRNKNVCPECSTKLVNMKNPKYLRYSYFYNVQRRKTRGIKAKCISEAQVDKFLIDFFEEHLEVSDVCKDWIKYHVDILHDEELETRKRLVDVKKKELKSLHGKKAKLKKLFLNEVIDFETFKHDVKELEEVLNNKNTEYNYAENWHILVKDIFDTLHNFKEIIKKADYFSKKKLLKLLSSNLVWNEEKLLINKGVWLSAYIKGLKLILIEFNKFEPENYVDFKGLNSVLDVRCPSLLSYLDKIRKTYNN